MGPMKKYSIALCLCLIIYMIPISTNAESVTATTQVKIVLDEVRLTFEPSEGAPFIDKMSRTQIPFRGVLEAFGATVTWDAKTSEAVAIKDDVEVRVPIGERFIIKNSEVILIDTKAVIIQSRTYLPARSVLEAFGAEVTWDSKTRTVKISSPGEKLVISRLPSKYDLREFNKLSVIKNQHDIGACWAFATLGAIESSLLPNHLYDFSEDHMSLSHGYNLTQDEGGDFQLSLAYLSRWSGPVFEVDDPYGDGVYTKNLKAAIHVQEAIILPEKDYSAIKRGILQYGGVQTSIHIRDILSQEFGDAFNDETDAFYYQGDALPNHDVVIVGWDDQYSSENFNVKPKRDGAFICRNSYGETFGNEGYFYVSYEDHLIGRENIVYSRIEPTTNYGNIYQSDWLGWVGRIGFGKDTAYFSNVYTSQGPEKLKAVSFYATDADSTYEVYVVDRFTDEKDFESMRFIKRGLMSYAGYYTVDFEQAIEVDGSFAVIVKITTPGSTFPVAAEYDKDVDWLLDVDITDGRGYMSFDGKSWESTEEILDSNVCLKAFTSGRVVVKPVIQTAPTDKTSTEKVPLKETIEETKEEIIDEAIEEPIEVLVTD